MNVSSARRCLNCVDVLVLAGGLGTRIRPVLGDTPKLLAPIGGRVYLEHLLDWLAHRGARRVVLALGHGADAILAYLAQYAPAAIAVETVVEPEPLGTAGAIRWARPRLLTDPVLIVNGDSFAEVDLSQFYNHHRSSGAVVTLLCAKVANAGRYGRVQVDHHGKVHGFIEKDPLFHGVALVNAGMYLASAAFLDGVASSVANSLEREVLGTMPPGSLAAFTECRNFIDVGTPESLALADAFFRQSSVRIGD